VRGATWRRGEGEGGKGPKSLDSWRRRVREER